jgi:hypothetical protein
VLFRSVTAGTGVTITGAVGEGVSQAVSIGQAVATTSTVTFGALTVNGAVTLGDSTGDVVKILNIFTTSVATESFNPKMFNSLGATPGRFFRDTSSERYKTNILYMEDCDDILNLQSVSYHDKVNYEEKGEESPRQYGFLAEDLDANTSTIAFVNHDLDGNADDVQYDRLVVPLHSAMRKLKSRIGELEARLAALENV